MPKRYPSVIVSDEMWGEASRYAEAVQKADGIRSSTRFCGYEPGMQDLVGSLGVLAVEKYLTSLNISFQIDKTVNVNGAPHSGDIRILDTVNDIKTQTFKASSGPMPHWYFNVFRSQVDTRRDYYISVFLNLDTRTAFLPGFIQYDEFKGNAVLLRKGDLLYNGLVVKEDMFCVPVSSLTPLQNMWGVISGHDQRQLDHGQRQSDLGEWGGWSHA
jgi:hypothetical protein